MSENLSYAQRLNANTSAAQLSGLIGNDKRVLLVGYGIGELATVLAEQQACAVDGFEMDQTAAATVATKLHRAESGHLDRVPLSKRFGAAEGAEYDVVAFVDAVHHLADPVAALRDASSLLNADGRLVLSTPNVTHGSVRLRLLLGGWETLDASLRQTLPRYLSRAGVARLVELSGLVVDELRATVADPLAMAGDIDPYLLPDGIVEWIRDQPDAYIHEFQLSAQVRTSAEQRSKITVQAAAAAADVRAIDEHTEQRVLRAREVLRQRDHAIGLQAQATTARRQSAEMEAKLTHQLMENSKAYTRVREKNAQIRAVRQRILAKNETIIGLRRRIQEKNATIRRLRKRITALKK